MNQTKYYRADQLEFPFLQEIDAKYYSDRTESLSDEDLYDFHQNIENQLDLRNLNLENPWWD